MIGNVYYYDQNPEISKPAQSLTPKCGLPNIVYNISYQFWDLTGSEYYQQSPVPPQTGEDGRPGQI